MTTVSGLNILFVKYSVELHVKHSLELSIQLQLVDGVPDRFFSIYLHMRLSLTLFGLG